MGWSVSVELSKTGIAATNFLLMATLLGPASYGLYVVMAAFSALITSLATAGYSQWVQPLAKEYGLKAASSAVISLSVTISLPMLFLIGGILFASGMDNWVVLFLIVVVEAWMFPVWTSVALSLLATGRLASYAFVALLVPAVKLGVSVVVLVVWGMNLDEWVIVASGFGLIGLLWTTLILARDEWTTSKYFKLWYRRGFGFAAVGSASAISENLDRLIVGGLLGATAAGTYGVGARFSSYGSVPSKGLALVNYPIYFERVKGGNASALLADVRRASFVGVLLGSVAGVSIVVAVLLLSGNLLSAYDQLLPTACALAAVVPLRSIQYACGDALYALGQAKDRLAVTVLGALTTTCMTLIGAHVGGLFGASLGVVVSALIVTILLAGAVGKGIQSLRGSAT